MRALQQGSIDLVILGEQIRQANRGDPLIPIAASGSEELAIAALRAGFNDYFKYPYDPEELVEAVKRSLSHLRGRDPPAKTGPGRG